MRQGVRVHFQKTRALFSIMVLRAPRARWYIKVDTDTVVNLLQMHAQLRLYGRAREGKLNTTVGPADYIGKRMKLFAYRASQRWFNASPPSSQRGDHAVIPQSRKDGERPRL